jgi:hypothetical protein
MGGRTSIQSAERATESKGIPEKAKANIGDRALLNKLIERSTARKEVFAYTRGNWVRTEGFEIIPIMHFRELIKRLEEMKLAKKIDTLSIVAHGDQSGAIQIPNHSQYEEDYQDILKWNNIDKFEFELGQLSKILTRNSKVVFYSCKSARGSEGDKLFKKLSLKLNCTVIGFVTYLWVSLSPSYAGQIKDSEEWYAKPTDDPAWYIDKPKATIESKKTSKWARNGNIEKKASIDEVPSNEPTYKNLPAWLDKEVWAARCDPREARYMVDKREKERGIHYYYPKDSTESCKKEKTSK